MNMKAYVCFNGGTFTDVMKEATWDCAVAGTLNNGTEITITGEQNGWYEITFGNSTAWILANRIFFAKTGAVCFSGGSCTDVMESATWDCAVTGQINNGIEVCIIGEQNGWYQIFFGNSTAWIPTNRVYLINMKGYVCFTGGPSSDIMSEATWDSTALTELNNGTEITIVGAQNGWYQIIYENSTAWILEERVYLITTTGYVNFSGGSCTDVMQEATWDCAALGQVNNGTRLYVIGQQSGWYQIIFENSTAWICVDRVSFEMQGYVCFAGGPSSDIMSEATWDSTALTELNNGTKIIISGQQNGWYQITFNGATAWILSSRVCIPEAGFPKIGCIDFSGGPCTDVMQEATWDCAALGQVNNGTEITIIGEQDGWYQILFDESTAWLPQNRVSFPRKAYVDFTTNGNKFTYVTKNPNFNNDGVGQLNNGTEICIIGEQDGWYQIKFEESTAWLPAERAFLAISGTICYDKKPYTYVTKNPNFNNDGVGKIYNGTEVTVIAEENGWYQIKFEGSTAWFPANRINISQKGYICYNGEVSIKNTPLVSSTNIGALYNNTEVYIVGEQNGWYQIAFNASTGWIQTQSVYVPSIYYADSSSSSNSNVNGVAGEKCSANLIYFTKGREGFAPSRYYDSTGTLTDGYGLTGSEIVNLPSVISEATATNLLTDHMNNHYYSQVLAAIKQGGVNNPLQREVDALTDFAYNLGVEALTQKSTLFKKYLSGMSGEELKPYFLEWDMEKSGGRSIQSSDLRERRELEWNMFCGNNVEIPGYNCAPTIGIFNSNDEEVGILSADNGYGASPY